MRHGYHGSRDEAWHKDLIVDDRLCTALTAVARAFTIMFAERLFADLARLFARQGKSPAPGRSSPNAAGKCRESYRIGIFPRLCSRMFDYDRP